MKTIDLAFELRTDLNLTEDLGKIDKIMVDFTEKCRHYETANFSIITPTSSARTLTKLNPQFPALSREKKEALHHMPSTK